MKRGIEYKIHGKVKAMFDVRPGRQISSPDGAIIYEYLIKYIADVVKFTVEADPSEITTLTIPQSSKEILLTVYPNPKTQSTMLDLIVSGYDAHGNSSSHKLSVGSSAVREARVIPSDLNWGVVQLGKVERNTIHVPGVTSQNAIIDAVASDASLSVEIGAYSDGHVGAKFDITHRIDKLGEQKSYIDIRLKSDKGVNPIRIPVYYWGVEKL